MPCFKYHKQSCTPEPKNSRPNVPARPDLATQDVPLKPDELEKVLGDKQLQGMLKESGALRDMVRKYVDRDMKDVLLGKTVLEGADNDEFAKFVDRILALTNL